MSTMSQVVRKASIMEWDGKNQMQRDELLYELLKKKQGLKWTQLQDETKKCIALTYIKNKNRNGSLDNLINAQRVQLKGGKYVVIQ